MSESQTLYIFITGPQGAGKSSLLASLGGDDDFFIDHELGIEYRLFDIDDSLQLCVIAPVDGSRFESLMEIDPRDLLGYILVVDSTDPDSWSLAQMMLKTCRGYALLPTLVAANKQDSPRAHKPERLGEAVGMDSMMQILGLVAVQRPSARELFLKLLYTVEHEMEMLDILIARIEDLLGSQGS